MSNLNKFKDTLAAEYKVLFLLPKYQLANSLHTPESMSDNITEGLLAGTASNDGDGVKATCKALGIKKSYKAIREYLGGES
jgi:hypothetical protein